MLNINAMVVLTQYQAEGLLIDTMGDTVIAKINTVVGRWRCVGIRIITPLEGVDENASVVFDKVFFMEKIGD